MQWAPITIRRDIQSGVVVSGVYFISPAHEIAVTVSQKLKEDLSKGNGKAAGALNCSQHEVIWEDLTLASTKLLTACQSELRSLGAAFNFPSPELLVFEFVNPPYTTKRVLSSNLREFRPSCLEQKSLLSKGVSITSSPFASVHTALFHGYQSTGIVSLLMTSIVLVDARVLDGMEGGMVIAANGSVGLVLGPLIKTNGDGRLLAVLSWSGICACLPDRWASMLLASPEKPVNNFPIWQGVVSVMIKLGTRVSWGSGVLITRDTVATNKHVVRDHSAEKLQIRAGAQDLRSAASITTPLHGLDLVFIKLDKPIIGLDPVRLAAEDPHTGDPVKSIGFGLFLPRSGSIPLESRGIISKNGRGMLISSAGCWNGSSGGGLFNQRDELVGLMAANARENDSGEIISDMCMAIPVSLLRAALSHQKLDPKLPFLWKLQPTYQNVPAKL